MINFIKNRKKDVGLVVLIVTVAGLLVYSLYLGTKVSSTKKWIYTYVSATGRLQIDDAVPAGIQGGQNCWTLIKASSSDVVGFSCEPFHLIRN